jgi:hypothetical protein
MGLGDLGQAQGARSILPDRVAVELERLAPDLPAFEPGPAHAGADPLDNQVPFQLGDGADDHHDGATRPTDCADSTGPLARLMRVA